MTLGGELTEYTEPAYTQFTDQIQTAAAIYSVAHEERVWAIETDWTVEEGLQPSMDYSLYVDEAEAIVDAAARNKLASSSPIRLVGLPVPMPPLDEAMTWHPRFERDPAHLWLRMLMQRIASAMSFEPEQILRDSTKIRRGPRPFRVSSGGANR